MPFIQNMNLYSTAWETVHETYQQRSHFTSIYLYVGKESHYDALNLSL